MDIKIRIQLLLICLVALGTLNAQTNNKKEPAMSKKDNYRLTKLKKDGTYPLIKASPFSGVLPVNGISEKADKNLKYKLVVSLTTNADGEKSKEINRGLAEVGRIMNLHMAAGVPRENLEVVIVVHSRAAYALVNNDAYKKEYKVDNPNCAIIKEMEDAGAKFIVCGQTLGYLDIKNEDILPTVKIALAAKVALSTYQLKGYTLFEVDEE